MMDVPEIRELYAFNRWANERVLHGVAGLTVQEFTRDLASSYRSVRDTLIHILWAEWIWLQRWKGNSPRNVFDATEFPTVSVLRARWSEHEVEQRAFVESVTAERLGEVVAYVNLRGQTWRYPLWREMYHVVNHSTYHRGQITTMLRQLDKTPGATDFLDFHDQLDAGSF